MKPGHLVVVPYWNGFYVAEVAGPARDKGESLRRSIEIRFQKWGGEGSAIPDKNPICAPSST